jgi:hypothetical protein
MDGDVVMSSSSAHSIAVEGHEFMIWTTHATKKEETPAHTHADMNKIPCPIIKRENLSHSPNNFIIVVLISHPAA